MQEEFLLYLWKFRLFDCKNLVSTLGEPIEILKPGESNTDSGPDFFNARIKIGNTKWAGNVEVHIKTSDWEKHLHQKDKAYDNIILHVVYHADKKLFRKSGEEIPTLELKERIPQNMYDKYKQFKSSKDWIPCGKQIASIDKFTLNNWLDRLIVERLEKKSTTISNSLKQNKNNWEETLYQTLARNFGQKINAEPFELLAKHLPISVLLKHKNNLLQIEALLFGVAGMLEVDSSPKSESKNRDEYFVNLQREFKFLKNKFQLASIDSSLWKFMRLHPLNFPTIRISQFANLLFNTTHLFSKIIEEDSLKKVISLFHAKANEYWKTHYRFNKQAPLPSKLNVGTHANNRLLGKDTIKTIIINTIVPFLFVYGKEKGESIFCDRGIEFLEKLDAENNAIIKKWNSIGVSAKNAFETQGLLQLKNEYCSNIKCLECAIGVKLLN